MKPAAIVADEMFPEGAGPYMDIEEVCIDVCLTVNYSSFQSLMNSKTLLKDHLSYKTYLLTDNCYINFEFPNL